MGRKAQISIVAVVFVAIAAVLLAYWYDGTQKDKIAEGVTIGGVDVGGLDAEAAESQIRTNLVAPLEKTIKVTYDDETFELTAKEADVHTDIGGMVDEALEVSREGGLPTRVWRGITGGEVDHQIQPEITYDDDEVDHFINHIASNVDQAPVDASIDPSSGTLEPVASQPGIEVDEGQLRKDIEHALYDPASQSIKPETKKVEPEVTTAEVAEKYPTYIVVDRSNFTLTLYRNLKQEKQYTVAIGAVGFDTPTGEYTIQNKQVDPVWTVPDSDWAGDLAGRRSRPGPRTRSRRAGWGSSTAPASTAPRTPPPSAAPHRTAACGCRSPT